MAPADIHIGSQNKRRKKDTMLVENSATDGNENENKPMMTQPHPHVFALKGKKTRFFDDPETVLRVVIRRAEEIDRVSKDPQGDRRIYFVIGWVVHEEGFRTPDNGGLPNPVWNREYFLPSGKLNSGRFLHLEVYRNGCKKDPGTSRGNALVGRVRIPLPKKLSREEGGRYRLVKPRCSVDGFVFITMELLRKKHRSFSSYYKV